MKKKVCLFIVIGLLIVIGIGGKVVMDNQKDKKTNTEQSGKPQAEEIEIEKMSVASAKKYFCGYKIC